MFSATDPWGPWTRSKLTSWPKVSFLSPVSRMAVCSKNTSPSLSVSIYPKALFFIKPLYLTFCHRLHPSFSYFMFSIFSLRTTSSVVRSSADSDNKNFRSLSVWSNFSSISSNSIFVKSFITGILPSLQKNSHL